VVFVFCREGEFIKGKYALDGLNEKFGLADNLPRLL